MLINSSLGRNTLGFKIPKKNFERLGIAPGLSNQFHRKSKKTYALRILERTGTIAIAK